MVFFNLLTIKIFILFFFKRKLKMHKFQNGNIINKSLTQDDIKSFLENNDKIAEVTLDFFDKYIKICQKQEIEFRLDGGLSKYLRRWQYYWTVKNTPAKKGGMILDAGCGGSLFPFFLSGFYESEVIGIDIGDEELEMSKNLKKSIPGYACQIYKKRYDEF